MTTDEFLHLEQELSIMKENSRFRAYRYYRKHCLCIDIGRSPGRVVVEVDDCKMLIPFSHSYCISADVSRGELERWFSDILKEQKIDRFR
jgi:hypothetical protein